MNKHTLKEWMATTRYWSFPVSAMPVVVAVAYICVKEGVASIHWVNAFLALVGAILFHAAGNLLSDVGDYRSGADNDEAYAVDNLVKHRFEVRDYLRLSCALFVLGIAIGLFLTFRCGWPLLIVGVAGFLLTLLYTYSKNIYLSDLLIFLVFGVLILLGSSVAATGSLHYDVLVLSFPLGLITLSVLHVNNTVDIATDRAAGLHTVAMAIGAKRSVRLYQCYQLLPYLFVVVAVLLRWLPWPTVAVLLTLPVAVGHVRQAGCYFTEGRDALLSLDQRTAKLQLLFSSTLTLGLVAALWL